MILAVDFGGTTIRLGLVRAGRIRARSRLDAWPIVQCRSGLKPWLANGKRC